MTDFIFILHEGENGERLNLKKTFDWILNEMSYEDFRRLAVLRFRGPYPFRYKYMVRKEKDTPEAREDYLKYLMYKLIQNLETPSVELESEDL